MKKELIVWHDQTKKEEPEHKRDKRASKDITERVAHTVQVKTLHICCILAKVKAANASIVYLIRSYHFYHCFRIAEKFPKSR